MPPDGTLRVPNVVEALIRDSKRIDDTIAIGIEERLAIDIAWLMIKRLPEELILLSYQLKPDGLDICRVKAVAVGTGS